MSERPLILIADDQPDNLLVLCDLLERSYDVETVSDGVQVLTRLAAGRFPDVLLLDVLMPGLDGFETCRCVKETPAFSDLPVVFLTSLESTVDEERCLSLGAEDFIRKPFVPGVVLARIGNLLGRRETELRRRELAILEAQLAEYERNSNALRTAVDKLTAANAELERFNLLAAHDLREPARMVSQYAQLFEKRCAAKLDAVEMQYLDFLVTGARRIYDMVSGLLVYSHVVAEGETRRMVSAANACAVALDRLATQVRESGGEIVVGVLPDITADQPSLILLFQNMIGNALKFRDPARGLRIDISAEPWEGEWCFTIADNGIGIDAGASDIFNLLRQLAPGRKSGAGVGLAICKRVVERLGGRIWAESELGAGSKFRFVIPEAASDGAQTS